MGGTWGMPVRSSIDLTLWRWFFCGLGLVLVMLLRPQGLAGRRVQPIAAGDDVDEPVAPEPPPPLRVDAIPARLRERVTAGASAPEAAILDLRGLTQAFGGVVALNAVDPVVPRGALI